MKKLLFSLILCLAIVAVSTPVFAQTTGEKGVTRGSVSVADSDAVRFAVAVFDMDGKLVDMPTEKLAGVAALSIVNGNASACSSEKCLNSLGGMHNFTLHSLRFHLAQSGNMCYVYNQNFNQCNSCTCSYLVGGAYAQEYHSTNSTACKNTIPHL